MPDSVTRFISNGRKYQQSAAGTVSYGTVHHLSSQRQGSGALTNDLLGVYAYWVLNRSSPDSPPAFSAVSNSFSEVPAGLANYMSDSYVLVVSVRLDQVTGVPQGPLYDFLQKYGAGSALAKLEKLNTGFACGVRGVGFSYFLVAVAEQGVPGIEQLEHWPSISLYNLAPVASFVRPNSPPDQVDTRLYARNDRYIQAYSLPDELHQFAQVVSNGQAIDASESLLIVDFLPGADGKYVPVRVP